MWSWFLIFHKLEFLDNIRRKPRDALLSRGSGNKERPLWQSSNCWGGNTGIESMRFILLYSMFVRILRITVYNWWHQDDWFSGALKFRPLLGCVGKKNTAGLIWGRSFSLRSSWHLGQALAFPWGSEKHECLDETGLSTIFQRRFLILFLEERGSLCHCSSQW